MWTDCGIPDSHSSTEVQYSSTDVNSVAYYNCKDGYEGITVVERRCQGDGDWSGTAPECTLVPSSALAFLSFIVTETVKKQ